MHQTAKAKELWEDIPQDSRLKLLNSVYCISCKKTTGVGEINMTVKQGSLLIAGLCTLCGGDVARLVEAPRVESPAKSKSKKRSTSLAQKNNPNIADLVQFRSDTKAADLLLSVGKIKIKSFGLWNPEDEFGHVEGEPTHPYDKIISAGKRPAWEMENILPGFDPDDIDCPIGEGIDLLEAGDWNGAILHMKGLLEADARCLDAYAHLGNWYFELDQTKDLNIAKNYYKTGVAIGLKSIASKANDVFPWGLIDNRPFLRCLHGLGLCFYKQKKNTEALRIFSKMIWLNPSDNQGARFLINGLINGVSWTDFQHMEDEQARY